MELLSYYFICVCLYGVERVPEVYCLTTCSILKISLSGDVVYTYETRLSLVR